MLDDILSGLKDDMVYDNLLVGNQSKDDAAAYLIDDDNVVLSTTDFFMPIVDDPYTFGRIAATNAISDIYAMGGKPIMALAIFGWPIETLSAEIAGEVLRGGKDTCKAAGIPMAGGHSINNKEPIFGLSVNGLVKKANIKGNDGATPNNVLYLTKPLGIGILTTAQKRKLIEGDDIKPAIEAMCALNTFGAELSSLKGVTAVTDITGFGLIGHLTEMCEGSAVSAVIDYNALPKLPKVDYYIDKGAIPGGTKKNYAMYGGGANDMPDHVRHLICDAQTSGGLLIAVEEAHAKAFELHAKSHGLDLSPIGHTTPQNQCMIDVKY